MAKIRMIIIEGEMSPDETVKLARAFGAGDEAFTTIALPNGITGQVATLSRNESQPRPRPVAAPVVEQPAPPAPVVVAEDKPLPPPPAPAPEIPPAVAKVFPEAVVEAPEQAPEGSLLTDLQGCKRLASLLERLQQEGHSDLPALIAACKQYRDAVPLLQRLGDGLEDRVTRTFEGMK